MKKQITPCLWFNNQAKEAAELYCTAFADAKISSQSPIVTEISISGQQFILLDGGPMYRPNPSISFYCRCETDQEVERLWNAFSKEGTVMMALDRYPWSEKYGWVTDKYGVSWQIGLTKAGEIGQKIVPCLMFTGKEYGRADEALAHYAEIFKHTEIERIVRYSANEAPDVEGKVKWAAMAIDGQEFAFMESAAPHDFAFSEGVSFTVYCETQEEIDCYWEKFTKDGEESRCGWLKDKFGVSWQIIPSMLGKIMSDPNKAGKAAQAFMAMRKLNIEQIVKASIS